jgi:hypothetical protein
MSGQLLFHSVTPVHLTWPWNSVSITTDHILISRRRIWWIRSALQLMWTLTWAPGVCGLHSALEPYVQDLVKWVFSKKIWFKISKSLEEKTTIQARLFPITQNNINIFLTQLTVFYSYFSSSGEHITNTLQEYPRVQITGISTCPHYRNIHVSTFVRKYKILKQL